MDGQKISTEIFHDGQEKKVYGFANIYIKIQEVEIHFPLIKMSHLVNGLHRRHEANKEIIIAPRYRYNLFFFCKMSLA